MEGIIFVGLQASGKSSFYLEEFFKTHVRLNLDMLKTRNREGHLFNALLNTKQPLVIDNTNPTKQERMAYIQALKEHKFSVVGYYFSSCIADCLARNATRTGKERIPEVGIKGTYNKLEIPEFSEGFDQLYYVSQQKDGFSVEGWKDEI